MVDYLRQFVMFLLLLSKAKSIHLSLQPVGFGDEKMVVIDVDGSRTLCYPGFDEIAEKNETDLPVFHRDHGLNPMHEYDQLVSNARVICRQIGGYTHVVKVYNVSAPIDMPDSNKRVKWMAKCVGYEPLLNHCFAFKVSNSNSRCNKLLGLKCGYCSKKIKLNIGEQIFIASPGYPHYSDDVICKWTVELPDAAGIKIIFNDFELPARNEKGNCHRGELKIEMVHEDGYEEPVTQAVTMLCGSALPEPLSFIANGAVISFSSGLFLPRPVGEDAGFNLTVAVVAASTIVGKEHFRSSSTNPPNGILNYGEILAIVFGSLLVFFISFFGCFIYRRYWKDRKSRMQRRLMQERLDTQRQVRRDAALTAMLAVSLTGRHPDHETTPSPVPKHKSNGQHSARRHDITQKDRAFRTMSSQSRNDYAFYKGPKVPPNNAPPPPPPPFRRRGPGINLSSLNAIDYEEPIYMDATNLEKSFSYIQLDNIACDHSPWRRHSINRLHSVSSARKMDHLLSTKQGIPSPNTIHIPNNLDLNVSRTPYQNDSPRVVSSSAQNMTSSNLNLWPSTSSLTPSNKTVPLTPSRKKSMNLAFVLNSLGRSGGDNLSIHSGNLSPIPGHTPENSRRLSNLSQCSTYVYPNCESFRHSNTTLSDLGNTPHLQYVSQEKSLHTPVWTPLHQPTCHRVNEQDTRSFSSCESVFIPGAPMSRRQLGNGRTADCMCKECLLYRQHPHLASTINSSFQGHLSKSCGDVSPAVSHSQGDAILDNMHQSAPTLPGDQSVMGLLRPSLRRVSQMFLVPGSLHSSVMENDKNPDPKNFLESSKRSQESKILDKKLDGSGISCRKLSGKAVSEASLRKDRSSVSLSPRRPQPSSVSSASFLNYKYGRLDKVMNADCDALLPRSNSREVLDGASSPEKNCEPK